MVTNKFNYLQKICSKMVFNQNTSNTGKYIDNNSNFEFIEF